MTDRRDPRNETKGRRPAEGVRIIGAEEAQKALDEGQAAGRRSDDELRYGDVPPAPSGPRPTHRFPLPDSVDPAAAVPRPPIAPIRTEPEVRRGGRGARGSRAAETRPAEPAQSAGSGLDESEAVTVVHPQADAPATEAPPIEAPPIEAVPTAGAEESLEEGSVEEWTEFATGPTQTTGPTGTTGPAPAVGSHPAADTPHWEDTAQVPAVEVPPAEAYFEADEPEDANRPPRTAGEAAAELAAHAGAIDLTGDGRPLATPPTRLQWAEEAGGEHPPAIDDPAPAATAWRPPPPADPPSWSEPEPDVATPAASMHPSAEVSTYAPEAMGPEHGDADPTIDVAGGASEDRITVGSGHELPHWTEHPPAAGPDDEQSAWDAVAGGASSARWRSEHDDWDDLGEIADLTGEGQAVGALDSYRDDDPSGMYSFDEDFERLEEERSGTHAAIPYDDFEEDALLDQPTAAGTTRIATRPRGGARPRTGGDAGRGPAGPGRPPRTGRRLPAGADGQELSSRLGVGVGLGVVAIVAYVVGAKALLVLAAAVLLACAVEAYGILRRSGFRPATMLGLVATVGFVFAAYWRGEAALPLVAGLTFAATMVWYLLGIVDARPLANVAVTSMTVLWVGLLGSYAALMLRVHDGRGLLFGTVAVTVLADIVAYLVGRSFGHRPMAPSISPGKTMEGLVAGAVAALIVGLIVGKVLAPWAGIKHGLLLGVVVAVVAPIGDLFESLIKRDLSVKDSGSSLRGHGGLLDRFDSLLLVLPAAYYLADALHLLR